MLLTLPNYAFFKFRLLKKTFQFFFIHQFFTTQIPPRIPQGEGPPNPLIILARLIIHLNILK